MALVSRAFGTFLKLPPALTRDVAVHRDVKVTAPDGVALLTDLYLARPAGPLPTILIRCPYGRRNPWGGTARLFAERGYHAVVQSTRGTFGSGGEIDADCEAGDGRATADWIIDQPWSNGELGTFGGSYLGFTQLALASTRPPQLKAMALGVWGAERRAGYFPGGSFALDRALNWVYSVHYQERSRLAMFRAGRALRPAFGHLPLLDADVVAIGRPAGYYRGWLEHDQPGDPYWTPTDFRPILPALGIPVTMIAGWYDLFLPLMLTDYQTLRAHGQQVRLRIGAWRHSSPLMLRHSLHDALDWFAQYLRHEGSSSTRPPIEFEVMGGGGWRQVPDWPPAARAQRWHLQPGRALSADPPTASEPELYRYDPAEPTPAVGGTSTGPNSGPKDNRELEGRPDVLTFSSEPLDATLDITGPVRAELYVTSTLLHTDFFARLCDVDPKGRSTNVTDGLLRLTDEGPWATDVMRESGTQAGGTQASGTQTGGIGSNGVRSNGVRTDGHRPDGFLAGPDGAPARPGSPGQPPAQPTPGGTVRRVLIDLWPTAHRFQPGHRIRLQVSSGAHPRFARNPGTGQPLATATSLQVAEQTVYHDPERPSAVLLPVAGTG